MIESWSYRIWFKVRETSSSICPPQEMSFQPEPDPGEKVTQSVSGQNLKLPSREEDNLCENNLLASNPQLALSHQTLKVEQSHRAGSELSSPFTKVKSLIFLNLGSHWQWTWVNFTVVFNLGNLYLVIYFFLWDQAIRTCELKWIYSALFCLLMARGRCQQCHSGKPAVWVRHKSGKKLPEIHVLLCSFCPFLHPDFFCFLMLLPVFLLSSYITEPYYFISSLDRSPLGHTSAGLSHQLKSMVGFSLIILYAALEQLS